jgi:hypothetical protein
LLLGYSSPTCFHTFQVDTTFIVQQKIYSQRLSLNRTGPKWDFFSSKA